MVLFYRFSCPYCTTGYANRLSPILLGTGTRNCVACKHIFSDKSREWVELTPIQKFQYFLPPTVLGFVGGALVMAVLTILILRDEINSAVAIAGLILLMFAGPWIPYFLLQWRHIPRSQERFQQRCQVNADQK